MKHLRLFYPILRAGLPVQGADGVYSLPAGATSEEIRRSVLSYIGYVLANRLAENGVSGDIRPDALAAVFEPGAALEQAIGEVTVALTQPAPTSPPAPVPSKPAKPSPSVEEMHTPASYMKLLKAGGAKGSETESLKILPVPWPSVERVCTDIFPLLYPGAGGSPLPREQLTTKLVEAGKDLFLEQYPQHVRRALGILRVAGDLIEENGTLSLNADVTSAAELRNRALAFLLQLLQLRLEEREHYDPIHPQAFVTALEAGPLTDRLVEEVTPAIAWLYRPAEEESTTGELAPAELVAEGQAEPSANGEATAPPSPDSEAVEVGVELVVTDSGLMLAPTNQVAPAEPPATPNAEPTWDPYAFDGVLPEEAATEANYNTPPIDPPQRAMDTEVAPTDSPSAVFGVVDVAALTSEAVAAAAAETPPAAVIEPATTARPLEPEAEPFAFAPPVTPPAPPANEPPTQVEEILTAVPVADWLPDGDPLFPEVTLTNRPNVPTPAPAEAIPVAKIAPPPSPTNQDATSPPPPFPPLPPPESA